MFVNKNSLKIRKYGTGSYVNLGNYITQVEYGYNKLWGKDTGRNLKGRTTGTLLGIVVKLKLSFAPLTKSELELLSPILNSAYQNTQYYDPDLQQMTTIQTYTGDWATLNKNSFENVAKVNEAFDISVIATVPRSV